MNCNKCNCELEINDNFCPKCGEPTLRGARYVKENYDTIINGNIRKQKRKLNLLISVFCFLIIVFGVVMFVKGENLFKPFGYIEKKINYLLYGYNTSLIKTDNKYSHESVEDVEEAYDFIRKDFEKQEYNCDTNKELSMLEYELEDDLGITSVMFCDMSMTEALKIKDVLLKMNELFPNTNGALTNITISNSTEGSSYIAYFQPMYQFVNNNESINSYNKVNKTQILLNSYYFLNNNILNKNMEDELKEDLYVEGSTWESTIAHELGHYYTFLAFLRANDLENVTFMTKDNYDKINNVMEKYEEGLFQEEIVNAALNNYNRKNNKNYSEEEFAKTISNYATKLDESKKLSYNEIIAEAVHDYYLKGNSMKSSSKEIVTILKEKLGE